MGSLSVGLCIACVVGFFWGIDVMALWSEYCKEGAAEDSAQDCDLLNYCPIINIKS